MYDERLKAHLPRVEERIAAALERSGRAERVRLVAVTKGHSVAAVEAAYRAGIAAVGENRVQELDEKREAVAGDVAVEWHLIGHLQRNKARRAIQLFDLVHSVDSVRLGQELSREAVRAGVTVRALVQVNASGETTKGGFTATSGDAAQEAVAGVAALAALPGMRIEGLMTMAPFTDDEGVIRTAFARTRELLERCVAEGVPLAGRELSMGMSGDYEIAIEEGSTMIRLGTVLFGERA
jgi:PLP dependent protein